MIRVWILFILLVALIVWGVIFLIKKRRGKTTPQLPRFAAKAPTGEIWAQLYETDSLDEITVLRAQLQSEKLDYLIYEQGKRDSHGNVPKKFGIVMSKGHLSRGQAILARVLS
jgi:hypothetical protein